MASRAISFALVSSLLVGYATAYPSLWTKRRSVECGQHPAAALGSHAAPKPDPTIKFAVLDAANKPAAALGPGQTYTIQLTFPQGRFALLTADAGRFARASAVCPSQQVIDATSVYTRAPKQDALLTVPCTRTQPIALKVTSATGSTGGLLTSTTTLPVNVKARAPSCG